MALEERPHSATVSSSRRAQSSTGPRDRAAQPREALGAALEAVRPLDALVHVLRDAGEVARGGRAERRVGRVVALDLVPERAQAAAVCSTARFTSGWTRAGKGGFVETATRSRSGARSACVERATSSSAPIESSSAVSRTLRVTKPATLSPYQCSCSGVSGIRSRVGLRPDEAAVRGRDADRAHAVGRGGRRRTAPPPRPRRCRRSSRPALRSVFHGLRVMPNAGPSVSPMIASSGQFVLPMITAPAARSRRTSSLSCAAGFENASVPQRVTSPVTSSTSLTAIGTPSSGRSSPAPRRPSACWASTSARSDMTLRNAFSCGLSRSIRSR